MNSQTLIYLVIGIAVLGLLIFRNLRAQPVRQVNQRLFLVLGVIGVIETYQYLGKHHAGTEAIAALAGSLVLAAVFGVIREAALAAPVLSRNETRSIGISGRDRD